MKCDELKMSNNPCKYCNGEIDEGKPLCGDLVNLGDVCCMVKSKDGFDLEYWNNFENQHFIKINFCPICGRKITEERKADPCDTLQDVIDMEG